MSSIPPHFNFAKALGIESLAAAIVFTVLYASLLVIFARKSLSHPTYVHYTVTFFCTIRLAAFAIRVALTSSKSAGESLGLVIADEVLFTIGYFSLLYSAYALVLDLILLSDSPPPKHPLLRIITRNRKFFRFALFVPVNLGIAASARTNSNGTNSSTAQALHIASAALFLALTVIQALLTITLAMSNMSRRSQYYIRGKDSVGVRYGNITLPTISLLLLIRETFAMATVTNVAKQNNEHFWYPFLAVTEVLVVILYTTPGLVPRRDELPSQC